MKFDPPHRGTPQKPLSHTVAMSPCHPAMIPNCGHVLMSPCHGCGAVMWPCHPPSRCHAMAMSPCHFAIPMMPCGGLLPYQLSGVPFSGTSPRPGLDLSVLTCSRCCARAGVSAHPCASILDVHQEQHLKIDGSDCEGVAGQYTVGLLRPESQGILGLKEPPVTPAQLVPPCTLPGKVPVPGGPCHPALAPPLQSFSASCSTPQGRQWTKSASAGVTMTPGMCWQEGSCAWTPVRNLCPKSPGTRTSLPITVSPQGTVMLGKLWLLAFPSLLEAGAGAGHCWRLSPCAGALGTGFSCGAVASPGPFPSFSPCPWRVAEALVDTSVMISHQPQLGALPQSIDHSLLPVWVAAPSPDMCLAPSACCCP